jgi:hypothetical protein
MAEATRLFDDPAAHTAMIAALNSFGDGWVARRIVDVLCGGSVSLDASHTI